MALHDTQELDHDFRGRSDENLTFAASLSINDVIQAVILYLDHQRLKRTKRKMLTHKDRYANHCRLWDLRLRGRRYCK